MGLVLRITSERSFMNTDHATGRALTVTLDDFAAALAEAAYPVMLRHGLVDNWLDLELELWRTMRKTVAQWPQASVRIVAPLSRNQLS
jgi:hypothetical protein